MYTHTYIYMTVVKNSHYCQYDITGQQHTKQQWRIHWSGHTFHPPHFYVSAWSTETVRPWPLAFLVTKMSTCL